MTPATLAARQETLALLALLQARPNQMTSPQIVTQARQVGSAQAVLGETLPLTLLPCQAQVQAEALLAEWDNRGFQYATVFDDAYPGRLLDIRETPGIIFYRGELDPADQGMSVVGSRQADAGALRIAGQVARLLVDKGLTVVSGLAAGIDTAAHEAALAAGGRTVAILGTGIDKYYPAENRELQDRIAASGLLLTQFWPGATGTKQSFPMRNAVMSGYGYATIIVAAGEHSGTRTQASKAISHGRPVIMTEQVATGTTWGAQLVGRPGVYVVTGMTDLAAAVDQIMDPYRTFDDLMRDISTCCGS